MAEDAEASLAAYARCCRCALRAMANGSADSMTHMVCHEAVFACNYAFGRARGLRVAADSDAEVEALSALRDVVSICKKAQALADVNAAVVAHLAISYAALRSVQPARAARHIRRALALAERAGPLPDARTPKLLEVAAYNLSLIEQAKTPGELAQVFAADEQLWVNDSSVGELEETIPHALPIVERPACSACGKTPLTLKLCGGTCGGAARYCDAACHAAHIRQHMRESGCKKRK
jgi:hypothetical protein